MRDTYDIVRDFFRDGAPASRNQAYDAYQDPRFARAVRIYQYLVSVREQVLELLERGGDVEVEVVSEPDQVVLQVRYAQDDPRGELRRTAYLKPEEWELLRSEPRLAALLQQVDPAA
jgi:hypothetical protein